MTLPFFKQYVGGYTLTSKLERVNLLARTLKNSPPRPEQTKRHSWATAGKGDQIYEIMVISLP